MKYNQAESEEKKIIFMGTWFQPGYVYVAVSRARYIHVYALRATELYSEHIAVKIAEEEANALTASLHSFFVVYPRQKKRQ